MKEVLISRKGKLLRFRSNALYRNFLHLLIKLLRDLLFSALAGVKFHGIWIPDFYKNGIQTMYTGVVVDSRLVLQSLLESVLVATGNYAHSCFCV